MTVNRAFARNHKDSAVFQTELGPATIVDARSWQDEFSTNWVNADIAEIQFNVATDPDTGRDNWPGQFTVNGKTYKSRIQVGRNRAADGGIWISTGRFDESLTDAARKKITPMILELVKPLLERMTEQEIWERIESGIRGSIRSALKDVPRDIDTWLGSNDLTHYKVEQYSNLGRTSADADRAHDFAVKILNDEIRNLPTVLTLRQGFVGY